MGRESPTSRVIGKPKAHRRGAETRRRTARVGTQALESPTSRVIEKAKAHRGGVETRRKTGSEGGGRLEHRQECPARVPVPHGRNTRKSACATRSFTIK